ncbi:hypothetical protein BH09BAC6_BH09BAC6_16310 [soil metagenome]
MKPAEKLLYILTPERLKDVGAIAVLAGSIEFRLERVLWSLTGESVTGQKPSTDTKPVSILIENLFALSEKLGDAELKGIIKLWTQIAKPSFRCRNSILHGLAIVYNEKEAEFMTNTRWEGELRKRDSSSFHVNEHTLKLLSSIFQTLLDSVIVIELIADKKIEVGTFFTADYIASMLDHRSVANEIVDLAAAVNHEKY